MISAIAGDRESGQDVRTQNVTAVSSIANILKTSLGPQGMDKMIVDDIGDVTITNDGATILKQLEVEHPAAKVLVDLSTLQDSEVGDGTTSVVIIAAELLKRANNLVKNGIHPTSIISGYKLAMKEAIKYIGEKLSEKLDTQALYYAEKVAMTTLSSKFVGSEAPFFSKLVVDALSHVRAVDTQGHTKYLVNAISILKSHGQSATQSYVVPGYALGLGRACQGMPTRLINPPIALVDFNLSRYRLQLGVQILVDDPKELEKIRQKEMDVIKVRIGKILEAGAKVILTTKGIDDTALKYFVEAKCIAVRRVEKKDLRRIAKATGATVCVTLSTMEGEEKFDPAHLGHAEEVYEERLGDNDMIVIKGCKAASATTLILRGPNDFMLDEAERSLHDALCACQKTLESNQISPGGGAVEMAVSIYLEDFARTLGSREQLAIAAFAEALLVIPKTLAMNAAKDSVALVARLRAQHAAAQSDVTRTELRWSGLDLIEGKIVNNLERGVVEPTLSKQKSLKFATEAAITLLRIDDLVKLHPEPERPDHGCH
eukprot:GHVL01006812.1.p1 GENE.GHVL01006812.1~~GHVL01006812.1.p1  ORF type:complete len:544 (+),score=97.13 GHVL01006812.1:32-1663(+)